MKVYRMSELTQIVGLGRSTIYSMIARGEFPVGFKLGSRARGWEKSCIEKWLEQCASGEVAKCKK